MAEYSSLKGQFIDVIDCVDEDKLTVVVKYVRPYGDNNEIKKGAKVIVRPSQIAVFVKGGQIADILKEGTHKINTGNLPILSTLMAFPYLFNSPIKADLYFISLKQFVNNSWETKNPLIIRDAEFNVVRIRARGKFSFRVDNVDKFLREIFGVQKRYSANEINGYLCSFLDEAFNVVLGELKIPIIDLAFHYEEISRLVMLKANNKVRNSGIIFANFNIENISLPKNVEKLIDEQSGIGMASKNMDGFVQYQSARAIRDAAQQPGGIAGIGASFAVANQISKTMADVAPTETTSVKVKCPTCETLNNEDAKFCSKCGANLSVRSSSNIEEISNEEIPDVAEEKSRASVYEELREYKQLLDEGAITEEEFKRIKSRLLG